MKNHVTSLELSKKMKELGFPQESEFKSCEGHTYYDEDETGSFEPCEAQDDLLNPQDEYCHSANLTCEHTISRYLASELGEWLPQFIETDEIFDTCKCGNNRKVGSKISLLDIRKCEIRKEWLVRYVRGEDVTKYCRVDSMANAMAKMLIYLAEKEIINPKEL